MGPAKVRELLLRVLPRTKGTHKVEDILCGVEDGRFQLWEGQNSVVVTELLDTPHKSIVNFFLAAGNMAEIEALYATVIAWAKDRGCDRAQCIGRTGWMRSFLTRKEDWEPTAVLFTKELG